jgi:hypothetical protein
MMRFKSVLKLGLLALSTALLFGQSSSTRFDWPAAYGGPYEIPWQAVPTTLTALDTRDVHLIGYCVSNNTGASLVFTIQTKDGSPLPLPLSGTVAANTAVCNNSPFGLLAKGGFSVQAGGTGLYYQVVWTH